MNHASNLAEHHLKERADRLAKLREVAPDLADELQLDPCPFCHRPYANRRGPVTGPETWYRIATVAMAQWRARRSGKPEIFYLHKLASRFWPDLPPKTAAKYLSNFRREYRDEIESEVRGYSEMFNAQ